MTEIAPPPSGELLALQQLLAGRYSIERELGRGGMGIVFLARDVALDRLVAIKLLPPQLANPAARDRFLREARTAAGLSHPNIVPIHAVEQLGDCVFFVMGYVDGETLRERVARTGPLAPRLAMKVMQEVGWALAYAHRCGVIHRDVKPDNIMIERGTDRELVTDFGIAVRGGEGKAGVADAAGTARYMSPEQALGEAVDERSDVYRSRVGHRLRHRRARWRRKSRRGRRRGHGALHEPGTSTRRGGGRAQRRLFAWRDALLRADRPAAVRGDQRPRDHHEAGDGAGAAPRDAPARSAATSDGPRGPLSREGTGEAHPDRRRSRAHCRRGPRQGPARTTAGALVRAQRPGLDDGAARLGDRGLDVQHRSPRQQLSDRRRCASTPGPPDRRFEVGGAGLMCVFLLSPLLGGARGLSSGNSKTMPMS